MISFWGIVLEYSWKKSSKKIFFWYYFVQVCVKKLPKEFIFKVFQIHLQVFLLLKSNGYNSFYTNFEGPNVDEKISYFGHL